MPDNTLPRHHIHKLIRLAAVLDRQGRHAEADRLDRIIRQAQAWNPIRTFKNTRNWWAQTLNGDNPTLLLRNMQDALEQLAQDTSQQTWFAGLDDRVRPVALAIVSKALENFRGYADRFNAASRAPTAHPSSPPRTASLAMGVARDCNDIIGLLGPLADENTFKGGIGEASVSTDGVGTVQVRVQDWGTGINMENLPQAALSRGWGSTASLGHGLVMMLQSVDRLWLLTGEGGTTVVLEQDREEPPPAWL